MRFVAKTVLLWLLSTSGDPADVTAVEHSTLSHEDYDASNETTAVPKHYYSTQKQNDGSSPSSPTWFTDENDDDDEHAVDATRDARGRPRRLKKGKKRRKHAKKIDGSFAQQFDLDHHEEEDYYRFSPRTHVGKRKGKRKRRRRKQISPHESEDDDSRDDDSDDDINPPRSFVVIMRPVGRSDDDEEDRGGGPTGRIRFTVERSGRDDDDDDDRAATTLDGRRRRRRRPPPIVLSTRVLVSVDVARLDCGGGDCVAACVRGATCARPPDLRDGSVAWRGAFSPDRAVATARQRGAGRGARYEEDVVVVYDARGRALLCGRPAAERDGATNDDDDDDATTTTLTAVLDRAPDAPDDAAVPDRVGLSFGRDGRGGTRFVPFVVGDDADVLSRASVVAHDARSCRGLDLSDDSTALRPDRRRRYGDGPWPAPLNVAVHAPGLDDALDGVGRALSLRDGSGRPIACGVLTPAVVRGRRRRRLSADVGVYPGYVGPFRPTGRVTITTDDGDDDRSTVLTLRPDVDGLFLRPCGTETPCGIHVHEGADCVSDVGPHYWDRATFGDDDPWNDARAASYEVRDGRTVRSRVAVVDAGTTLFDNAGRTVVLHDAAGTRVACGVLRYVEDALDEDERNDPDTLTATIDPDACPGATTTTTAARPRGTVRLAFPRDDGDDDDDDRFRRYPSVSFDAVGLDPRCDRDCRLEVTDRLETDDRDGLGAPYYRGRRGSDDGDPWRDATRYAPDASGAVVGLRASVETTRSFADHVGRLAVVRTRGGVAAGCGWLVPARADADDALRTNLFARERAAGFALVRVVDDRGDSTLVARASAGTAEAGRRLRVSVRDGPCGRSGESGSVMAEYARSRKAVVEADRDGRVRADVVLRNGDEDSDRSVYYDLVGRVVVIAFHESDQERPEDDDDRYAPSPTDDDDEGREIACGTLRSGPSSPRNQGVDLVAVVTPRNVPGTDSSPNGLVHVRLHPDRQDLRAIVRFDMVTGLHRNCARGCSMHVHVGNGCANPGAAEVFLPDYFSSNQGVSNRERVTVLSTESDDEKDGDDMLDLLINKPLVLHDPGDNGRQVGCGILRTRRR